MWILGDKLGLHKGATSRGAFRELPRNEPLQSGVVTFPMSRGRNPANQNALSPPPSLPPPTYNHLFHERHVP